MNLKSFPGPLPHFNVGGAAVMVGETRGRRGMVCSQTFGGPQHASVEGTPAIEVPKNGAPALSMGAGCPSCLLTPPHSHSLQNSVWTGGVLVMGHVQTGWCLHPCQNPFRPSHTDPDTSCWPCPPPPASHHLISQCQPLYTVYCLHCFGFCIIYTVN